MASMQTGIRTSMTSTTTTIRTSMTQMRSVMQSGMTASRTVMTTGMTAIKVATSSGMTATVLVVRTSLTQITTLTSSQMLVIQKTMSTSLTAIKSDTTSSLLSILSTTKSTFTSISAEITAEMNRARAAVSTAVSAMKSSMNFTWSLPYLKMPHITITGSFSVNPPTAPKFSVSWYKEGGILDGAQIFGAMGSTLLGGGEAGQEAVLPLAELWDQMRSIMAEVVSETSNDSSLGLLVEKLDAMAAGANEPSISDLLDWLNGDPDDDDDEPQDQGGDAPIYQITYAPTLQFYGGTPTQDDLVEAQRMSQEEFNEMMDEWVKSNDRKNF
jgi:hypothetical protein